MPFEITYSDKPLSHHIHTHVYDEMLYVQEGAVLLTIRGKAYRAEAGSLIFLNQFDEHATRLLTDVYRRYYLLIPPAALRNFRHDAGLLSVFRFHGEQFPYVLPTGSAKDRFDTYFSLLLDASARGGAYREERIEALMLLILSDASMLAPAMFAQPGSDALLPMESILDELDRHYAEPFSVQALAERFHVSAGCLTLHFRRRVGMSPMQYVMQSRLTRARELLLKTDASVMDIAFQCGYRDVSNFVRRFRQQFGLTPLQFRQQQRSRPMQPTPRG